MLWMLTKQRQVHVAAWFPETKAYDSCIIPRENKLIDNQMTKSHENVIRFTSTSSI